MTAIAQGENVILTGIARSGTTLACTLLNRLPGVVALNEPMSPGRLMGVPTRHEVAGRIEAFFVEQRRSLLERGEAASRSRDGHIPDNPYADEPEPDGRRRSLVTPGIVRFDKPLDSGFRLVIKHPSCFTALLDVLTGRFRCVAIVRNPLAVLLSWHTTDANWNDGRQPAAEAFDDDLRSRLDGEPDPLGRQLLMLGWSFQKYADHVPAEAVIRYEDIISTRGGALCAVDPAAALLTEPLENRNRNGLYLAADVPRLARRLLGVNGPWWDLYTRDDVADLARSLGE